jgi:DNA-binding MarR family transcriptional regulator
MMSRTSVVFSDPGVSISPEELSVWRTLLRVQVQVSRRLQTDLLAEHDLALGSYEVLLHLVESPGGRLRMNDLADRVLLSRSGLTRLVDRLQREGLVERASCEDDARGLFAVLTEAGRERVMAASPTHQQGVRQHVLSRLAPEEIQSLAAILDKLLDAPPAGAASARPTPARPAPAPPSSASATSAA